MKRKEFSRFPADGHQSRPHEGQKVLQGSLKMRFPTSQKSLGHQEFTGGYWWYVLTIFRRLWRKMHWRRIQGACAQSQNLMPAREMKWQEVSHAIHLKWRTIASENFLIDLRHHFIHFLYDTMWYNMVCIYIYILLIIIINYYYIHNPT